MKRIIRLILIIFLFTSIQGYSQMNDGNVDRFYNDCEMMHIFREKIPTNYEGSPYLNDSFQSGNIILANGKEYNDILLRYDTYRDQFEFSKGEKDYVILKNPDIRKVSIGEKAFVYRYYKCKNKEPEEGYLEQLVEGEYSLYLKHSSLLRAVEDIGAFSDASDPKFWLQKPHILIGNSANGIVEITGSRDLLNEFGDIQKIIANYPGKKKIKLKSREDYIELLSFLNNKG